MGKILILARRLFTLVRTYENAHTSKITISGHEAFITFLLFVAKKASSVCVITRCIFICQLFINPAHTVTFFNVIIEILSIFS